MKKNIVKIIVFLLIVVTLGVQMAEILCPKEMGAWRRYYTKEQKNIDLLVVGSSHAHCNVNQGLLWDEFGIAGYTLSSGNQMLDSSYYFIKEAVDTHKPKIIALEILGATKEGIENGETSIYRNSLPMRWSSTFWEYIEYFSDTVDMDSVWKKQIQLKIPIIHGRYKELVQEDFEDTIPFLKGYRGSYECGVQEVPLGAQTMEIGQLAEENREMLINVINYTKEKNIELVLFKSPFVVSEEEEKRLNAVGELAAENGVGFIDYNKLYEEIELDFETDFRDYEHLNNYGADKMTRHLGDFLSENYDMEDHRGQKGYESWEDNALYLHNKVLRHELEQINDINGYLEQMNYCKENYTVILVLTGNHTALGEVYLEKLMQLGITKDEYYTGGCWVFRNGEKVIAHVGKLYEEQWDTPQGEIHLLSEVVELQDGGRKEDVKLMINNEDYQMIQNGVIAIVYDEHLGMVIDAVGDDIYLGLELVHNKKTDL